MSGATSDVEVGEWRFCPHCARQLMAPETHAEDPAHPHFDHEAIRCSCCRRPWVMCPCSPASEGRCKAESDTTLGATEAFKALQP